MSTLQKLPEKYENGEGPGKVRYDKLYTPQGYNALHHLAATAGKTAACRFLIEKLKFDVNEAAADCVANGDTALSLSIGNRHQCTAIFLIENGSKETIKLLISKGADLNSMSDFGTPLHTAARSGNDEVLKCLLHLNAFPNPSLSHPEQTSLFAALKCKANPMERAKLLLEARADQNLAFDIVYSLHLNWIFALPRMINNLSPLESAAFVYRREVVKLLFPVTSPIPKYPHWSTSEVIQYQARNRRSEKAEI